MSREQGDSHVARQVEHESANATDLNPPTADLTEGDVPLGLGAAPDAAGTAIAARKADQ